MAAGERTGTGQPETPPKAPTGGAGKIRALIADSAREAKQKKQ